MKLILGSKSIGRRTVLLNAGYEFDILTSEIDEKSIRSDNYEQLPLLLARAKSDDLIPRIQESAILITSDQVVICNGELREKPESKEQAYEYLMSYSKYPAQTNTAVVVVNTKTGKKTEGLSIAKVFFNKIPEEIISKLIGEGNILHAAGGFIVENPLLSEYVKRIDGEVSRVTGLPLTLTKKLIQEVSS